MTTEVVEEQTIEQATQAFAAGFDDEQTPTPVSVETKPEVTPEPEAPKLAQITEAQFSDLLAKASMVDESRRQIDTLSGHLGGMKQVMEGLRKERKQLTPGQLTRVTANFPELAEDLQADLADLTGAPQVDPEEFGRRVSTEVESKMAVKSVEFEAKLLRFYHRDWKEVASSKDFQDWKSTLPEGERNTLNNSNDGEFIADKLTEFKSLRAKASDTAKSKSSDSRQRRLEAAVSPKGTGAAAASPRATSDFQAGWDSA